jgi:hypothetical protein
LLGGGNRGGLHDTSGFAGAEQPAQQPATGSHLLLTLPAARSHRNPSVARGALPVFIMAPSRK